MATITGTNGNDTIRTAAAGGSLGGLPNATDAGDTINGLAGDDTIIAGAGDDVIDGGDGADLIRGGAGNDTIRVGANSPPNGSDVAFGEDGDDEITGASTGNNFVFMFGGAGSDTIRGLRGTLNLADYSDRSLAVVANLELGTAHVGGIETDTLIGVRGIRTGSGDDQITGSDENDIIMPGLGNNIVNAGLGFDRISYAGLAAGVTVDLAAQTAFKSGDGSIDTIIGFEVIQGTNHADILRGDDLDNELRGLAGADVLDGRGGHDTANYNTAFQYAVGNPVFADPFTLAPMGVTVNLASGTAIDNWGAGDTLISIESVIGTGFADDLTGIVLAGGERSFLRGLGGNDTLRGASPTDTSITADYQGSTAIVQVNLASSARTLNGVSVAAQTARDGLGGIDTLINIQSVRGSNQNDFITGSARNDRLDGAGGNDTLNGEDGDDLLDGGAGDDDLSGGRGVDTFIGGAGYDLIRFQFDPSPTQGVVVDLTTGQIIDGYGNAETIPNNDVEMVVGSALDDTLTGKVLADGSRQQMRGREGNDTIIALTVDTQVTADYRHGAQGTGVRVNLSNADAVLGGQLVQAGTALDGLGGIDTLVNVQSVRGGDFADVILGSSRNDRLEGEGGDDEIDGGAGADALRGLAGNDILRGGDGDDSLYGGTGTDTYYGGAGLDTLRFDLENDGPNGVTVNLMLGTVIDPYGNVESIPLQDIERVVGTNKADHITGSPIAVQVSPGVINTNYLRGLGGNDTLINPVPGSRVGASYEDEARPVVADLTAGTATVQVLPGEAENTDTLVNITRVRGSNFDDTLIGSDGDDVFEGRGGNDIIDGRAGVDAANYFSAPAGIIADLSLPAAQVQDGYGAIDTLISVEIVSGSNFGDDIILGDGADNRLVGFDGNDVLRGRDGDDQLEGGAGSDELRGDAGNDQLNGGAGDDVAVYAGLRADYRVTENNGIFTIEDRNAADGDDGTDTLIAVERVRFADGTFPILALLQNGSADAVDDVFNINPGETITLGGPGLLANDTDADGDPLTVTGGTQGAKGVATYGADGAFTYVPNPGAIGTETLYYTISDGRGSIDVATITINIANQAPVANDDAFTIQQGGFLNALPPGLLSNDSDPDGHTLRVDAIVQGPTNGFINWTPQGRLFYEPFKPFSGIETIVYRITDGFGGFDTATVTITVTPIPNPPPTPTGPALPTFTQAYADPHLVTLDGLAYDFMAVGEFVAVRAIAGDPLEVQIRTKAVGEVVSSISGVAVGVGGVRVTVSADEPATLRIDGVVTVIDPAVGPVAAGLGLVFFDGQTYTVQYPGNELVRITDRGDFLDLSVVVSGARPPGQLQGLLGNLDGDPLNDLALPDGTVLAQPVAFAELYGAFADGWRVSDSTSLFDYGPGETTATYTNLNFPTAAVTIADLPPELVAQAAAAVAAAGVTDPAQVAAAVIDLILTGNPAFVASAAQQPAAAAVAAQPTGAPEPSFVGVTGPLAGVVEGDSGTTPLVFTLWRTGDTSAPLALDWGIVFATADAGDLAPGTPLGGTVTFAADEASTTITLALQGDTEFEADERLAVAIMTWPVGVTLAAPNAPVLIINDDLPPNLPPTAVADAYAVARGRISDIAAGFGLGANDSGSAPLTFALLDGPAAGEGSVVVNADGSFTYTTDENFVGLTGFTYTLTDAAGLSATGTVTLAVEERAETLIGTDGDDRLFGYGLDDVIEGRGGNDRLFGGDGNDTMDGGAGDDRIFDIEGDNILIGGDGNDILYAGAGNDQLDGGDGNDTLQGGGGDDVILGGAGRDKLYGGDGNDTLDGGADNDTIQGGDGDDLIDGGAGNDFLYGNAGNDVIRGGNGNDQIWGEAGNDDIDGGGGDDIIRGGDGINRINGGAGLDVLFGGADEDIFVLASRFADRDWINGFVSGTDRLEVDAALFGAGLAPGPLDPSRLKVGSYPGATAPGQFLFDTSSGVLRWDSDGPGGQAPEIIARLVGVSSLAATDFIVV